MSSLNAREIVLFCFVFEKLSAVGVMDASKLAEIRERLDFHDRTVQLQVYITEICRLLSISCVIIFGIFNLFATLRS